MPYIFKETLDENEKAADVLERDIADAIANERDAAKTELDDVKSKLSEKETELQNTITQLNNLKIKYAEAFLQPNQSKKEDEEEKPEDKTVYSFNDLFSMEV